MTTTPSAPPERTSDREPSNTESQQPPMLTFASGGWVVILAMVVLVAIVAFAVIPSLQRARDRGPGDGRDPATYGFDLSTSLVPIDRLEAGQLHRDLIPPIGTPAHLSVEELIEYNATLRRERHTKYLVPSDPVIGVEVDGVARAYPLLILRSHEVINDTLGETPIAITYNPLCDSFAVFDRRVGDDVLEFGVSGLLYNANLLLYDRRPDQQGESLWSQWQARAITGPAAAAGRTLTRLPAVHTQWGEWQRRRTHTTVIEPDLSRLQLYKEMDYDEYYRSDEIPFAFEPKPDPARGPAVLKSRCLVVEIDGQRCVYPYDWLYEQEPRNDEGVWVDRSAPSPIAFLLTTEPRTASAWSMDAEPLTSWTSYWFAAYAMDPEIDVAPWGDDSP